MKKHGSVGYTKLSFLGNKRSWNKFFMCKVNFSLYWLTQMQSKCHQRFWFDLAHYFKRCYSSQRCFVTLLMCFWKMFYCLQLRHPESFHLCKSRGEKAGESAVLWVCFITERFRVKCHWNLFWLLAKTHFYWWEEEDNSLHSGQCFLLCPIAFTNDKFYLKQWNSPD